MKNLLPLFFVTIFVFTSFADPSHAKRIKRQINGKVNQSMIEKDFALLDTGNVKISEPNAIENSSITKDDNSMFNSATAADPNTKSPHGQLENDKKFETIDTLPWGPIAYVMGGGGNRFREFSSNPPLIGETAMEHLQHLQHLQQFNYSRPTPPEEKDFNAIVNAHIVGPAHLITPYHTGVVPFSPFDQILKYANKLFYKVGIDDDNLENDNSPMEFNNLDMPQQRRILIHGPVKTLNFGTVDHKGHRDAISNLKSRVDSGINERTPSDLIELLEEVFPEPEEGKMIEEEIEIVCPYHESKNNYNYNYQPKDFCSCNLRTTKNVKKSILMDHKQN